MKVSERLLRLSFSAVFFVFCIFSCASAGKKEVLKNDLNGMIYDFDNKPAAMYTLTIEELGISAVSDITGRFSFADLPFGTYTIKGSGKDYESIREPFTFQDRRQIVYLKAASREQLYSMIYTCLEDDRTAEAASLEERLLSIGEKDETSLFYSAVIKLRQNEVQSALDILLELEKLPSSYPEVYLFISAIYENCLGDYEKAVLYLEKAFAISKSDETMRKIKTLKEHMQ